MGAYRKTRAIEASIIDYLSPLLEEHWEGINIEKSYARIYDISLPIVCIKVNSTSYEKVEIGSDSLMRYPSIVIDIFGADFGSTLDIKDLIIDSLKEGCAYYDYVVSNGQIQSKTANGRIRFLDLSDTSVNFDEDRDRLDIHDRHRWSISARISLGRVE